MIKVLLPVLLKITLVMSRPYQMLVPQEEVLLQQEMLQQLLQDHQRLQLQMPRPYGMDYQMHWPRPQLQPIPIIIYPIDNRLFRNSINPVTMVKTNKQENNKYEEQNNQETEDAVIIDAKPENNDLPPQEVFIATPYQGKYILGQIIMAIPFLPFEVNVPDTVAWAWNGISSIISGIGQRWPFNRPSPEQQEEANEVASKLLYKHLLNNPLVRNRNQVLPIFVLPLGNIPMGQQTQK